MAVQDKPLLCFSQHPTSPLYQISFFSHGGASFDLVQGLEESRQLTNWDAFVRALLVRFGPNPYEDPMEALTKLSQGGSVEEYKAQFETLSNKLSWLSTTYKMSHLLSGLKDEIRLPFRMFSPLTLTTTYSLSKLKEQNLSLSKRPDKPIFSQPPELAFRNQTNFQIHQNQPYPSKIQIKIK